MQPTPYMQAAIEGELAKLTGCMSAQDVAMNAAAFALGGMVTGWGLDEHEIRSQFLAACKTLPDLKSAKGKWTLKQFEDKWRHGMRDAEPRTMPVANGHAGPHKTATAKRTRPKLREVDLPSWTPPDEAGWPKFESVGKEEPARVAGEFRRHLYARDGSFVHCKVKYRKSDGTSSWLAYYHVQNKRRRGWQLKKPGNYVEMPYYLQEGIDPFDREFAGETLFWAEGERDAETLARHSLCAISFGSSSNIAAPFDELKGRRIVVFGDNDEAGRKFAQSQALALLGIAGSVKAYSFPELDAGGDVTDYVAAHGIEKLLEIIEALKPLDPLQEAVSSGRIFPFQIGRQIKPSPDQPWLIDRVLPLRGIGAIYGAPKSGKTFLAADAMFHIATGQPWHGREVAAGAICYVAAEGQHRFGDRVCAMFERYRPDGDVPFILVPVAPNLGDEKGDAGKIIETIRAALKRSNAPLLRAFVIDTLGRSMRGKDNNTQKDMGLFTGNCEAIAAAFDCFGWIVHHSGKDETRGMMGSTSLVADCVVVIRVNKNEDGSRGAIIEAMKDGPEGEEWRVELKTHAWESPEFEAIEPTCVVDVTFGIDNKTDNKKRKPCSPIEQALFNILRNAIIEQEGFFTGDPNVPVNVKSISRELAKEYAITNGWYPIEEGKEYKFRIYFNMMLIRMAGKGYLGLSKERMWLL